MFTNFLGIVFIVFLASVGIYFQKADLNINYKIVDEDPEIRWNWENIKFDPKEVATKIKRFSRNFLFGTATAAHQVEGDNHNSWSEFEKIPGRIRNGDRSGKACEHYSRFKDDIQLMKHKLGVKSYRFSIEWSRIEPKQGVFNRTEVLHYHSVIDELLKNGIIPMVTLHHFSDPLWWQEIGGFEYQNNLVHFEKFSEFVFREYSSKVKYWCTFNEVMMYSNIGFIEGRFPPGKTNTQLALTVVTNMLIAHTRVYHHLKTLPNGKESLIGFVKEYGQIDPVPSTNLITRTVASFWSGYTNDLILNYFTTGRIYMNVPFVFTVNYTNPLGMTSNDYIGINYYSHNNVFLDFTKFPPIWFGVRPEYEHLRTDMGYTIYGEGFYRALKRFSKLKLPIIVTENGVADHKDEMIRDTYIKRYLYAMSKAMEEGVDIRGYFYWSFMDNFEWSEGFYQRFGLYHVDYSTQKRTLRKGSQFFVDVVQEFNKL